MSRFSLYEDVLAIYGEVLFEAKIINTEESSSNNENFHMNKWDEWATEDMLMKKTEENVLLQQQILKTQKKKNGLTIITRRSTTTKTQNALTNLKQLQLSLSLKTILYEDYKMIHDYKNIMIHSLPAKSPVTKLLDEFVEQHNAKDSIEREEVQEIVRILLYLFNTVLESKLLYTLELGQLRYIQRNFENVSYANIYGAHHLLRLFVKLPDYIHASNTKDSMLIKYIRSFHWILNYLERKSEQVFKETNYIPSFTIKNEQQLSIT